MSAGNSEEDDYKEVSDNPTPKQTHILKKKKEKVRRATAEGNREGRSELPEKEGVEGQSIESANDRGVADDSAENFSDNDQDDTSDLERTMTKGDDPEQKERKSGIIYFQTIPPLFTASKMREELGKLAELGRIYLQAEKRRDSHGKRRKRYIEGWVEFKSKSLAKRIAASLNSTAVGGRRRSAARESLWTMKYLPGFKWTHLIEQLCYERKVEQNRMRAEISQAKRQADFFADQIEKGEKLRKLEEKVLKKGGKWEQFQRQVQQRAVHRAKKAETKSGGGEADEQLMKMIFAE